MHRPLGVMAPAAPPRQRSPLLRLPVGHILLQTRLNGRLRISLENANKRGQLIYLAVGRLGCAAVGQWCACGSLRLRAQQAHDGFCCSTCAASGRSGMNVLDEVAATYPRARGQQRRRGAEVEEYVQRAHAVLEQL